MKIVLVINHFQPQIGYQEFFLAQSWQRLGHQVTVVTSNYYFPFPHYEKTVQPILGKRRQPLGQRQERGITTIRLAAAWQMGGTVLALKKLHSTLVKLQPDVVYGNGVYFPLTYQVAISKLRLGFPLVYDTHASTFNTNLHDTFSKRLYLTLFRLGLPLLKRAVTAFTAVGTSEQLLLCREFGLTKQQVKVIPLGADTLQFHPDAHLRQDCRKKLKLHEAEVVFIHAGKLTAEKDVHVLIEAFGQVAHRHPAARLVIIGNGAEDYVQRLQALIKNLDLVNRILWLPPQPSTDLVKFYNAADVGVWPGNLSNTIQEAMACGKPVVVAERISAGQTTKHLVFQQATAQFSRHQINQLAKVMSKFITNSAYRQHAGEDALTLIQDRYSWDRIAQAHLKVYKK